MSTKKRSIKDVTAVEQPVATKVKKNAAVDTPVVVVTPHLEASIGTEVDNVRAKMEDFSKQVQKIKYGKRWKDEQTAEAVRKLEALNYVYIIGLILAIQDVDDQWTLALEYTHQIAQIVSTATQRAHKRVNGSWGEFCPDLAQIIATGLWRELCDKEERPNDEILDNVVQLVFLDKIFGDYADLSFVSEG